MVGGARPRVVERHRNTYDWDPYIDESEISQCGFRRTASPYSYKSSLSARPSLPLPAFSVVDFNPIKERCVYVQNSWTFIRSFHPSQLEQHTKPGLDPETKIRSGTKEDEGSLLSRAARLREIMIRRFEEDLAAFTTEIRQSNAELYAELHQITARADKLYAEFVGPVQRQLSRDAFRQYLLTVLGISDPYCSQQWTLLQAEMDHAQFKTHLKNELPKIPLENPITDKDLDYTCSEDYFASSFTHHASLEEKLKEAIDLTPSGEEQQQMEQLYYKFLHKHEWP
ncbi:uncharacterized protein FIBRA_05829 [Fibroporia radiculosa]|uniref:Uncharacterized protein n=1 Tax=Fibroporia radiculosa TaxID=599839 RepID=J4GRP5_9APHY|nr:uncharacterized protein FIBRA_05829 [Fibroporia radiculosa]CCM03685.1 predicted protein [Fibroporia radiculosa]